LVAGIFGTLIVPWTNGPATLVGQLVGVIMVGVFVCVVSAIIWTALKVTMGIRVSDEVEYDGLDSHEVGIASYPEFVNG